MAGDATPDLPKIDSPEVQRMTAANQAIPQFDAYPLPPVAGNAAIVDPKHQDAIQQNLLGNANYAQREGADAVYTKILASSTDDKAAVTNYMLAVNRDIRGKVADEDWAKYLGDKKPADLTDTDKSLEHRKMNDATHLKTNYDALQGIHQSEHKEDSLDVARENLLKVAGCLTKEELKDFEANRLAEAQQGQKLLAKAEEHHPAAAHPDGNAPIGQHPGHVLHHHRAEAGGSRTQIDHSGMGRGYVDKSQQEAEDLNKQELARITGQGQVQTQTRSVGEVPPVAPGAPAPQQYQPTQQYQPYQQYQQPYQQYQQPYQAYQQPYQQYQQPYQQYGGYGTPGIGIGGIGIGVGFGFGPHRPYYPPYRPAYYGGGAYYNQTSYGYNGYPTTNYGYGGGYPTYPTYPPALAIGFGFGGGWRRGGVSVIL